MKNLLILVIVVSGIVMFGIYTKPDDIMAQPATDYESLVPKTIDANDRQQAGVSPTAKSMVNSEKTSSSNAPIEPVSKSSHKFDLMSDTAADIPAPEVADVVKPEAERLVERIRGTKHQDIYTTTDLLDITRSNEERFQQIYKKINFNN